jgi:microfibrillar-associated protein 1
MLQDLCTLALRRVQEDEEGEYEAWKGREMSRIARDRDEKRREAAEAELRERLKHMTDDERRQWERANPKVWVL